MADLLSAIVRASKRLADPRALAFTSGNRPYTVKISRPGEVPTFNRATGVFNNPVDTLIYQGPARISPASEGAQTDFGGEQLTFTAVQISIDDVPAGSPSPRVDDLVEVLTDDLSTSTQIAGRIFTVTGVIVGGHFNIGFQLSATGAEPSRRSQ